MKKVKSITLILLSLIALCNCTNTQQNNNKTTSNQSTKATPKEIETLIVGEWDARVQDNYRSYRSILIFNSDKTGEEIQYYIDIDSNDKYSTVRAPFEWNIIPPLLEWNVSKDQHRYALIKKYGRIDADIQKEEWWRNYIYDYICEFSYKKDTFLIDIENENAFKTIDWDELLRFIRK